MIEISLKAARVNAGLSAVNVAELVGVHHQTIHKYEKDSSNIPFSLLDKLCNIYQIPSENIFLGNKYDLIRIIENKRRSA